MSQKSRYPVGEHAAQQAALQQEYLSKSKESTSLKRKLEHLKENVCSGCNMRIFRLIDIFKFWQYSAVQGYFSCISIVINLLLLYIDI